MLVGQVKKGRDVPYLPREENMSVGLCLPPLPMDVLSRRCPLLLPVPSGPPSTTILASANKVKGGDDVSVLCTVLGEPDVEVEFKWTYPGQKVSMHWCAPKMFQYVYIRLSQKFIQVFPCYRKTQRNFVANPINGFFFLEEEKKNSDWVPLGNLVNVPSFVLAFFMTPKEGDRGKNRKEGSLLSSTPISICSLNFGSVGG